MTSPILEPHHTVAAKGSPEPWPLNEMTIGAAREQLGSLLAQAAALELDDVPGWTRLCATAQATTSLLRAAALLPPHLHVRPGDPPVVVARTIAAASRRVDMRL